jgi:hypothetical protein
MNSYNWSRTGAEADVRAMWADWSMIAKDLDSAMLKFRSEYDNQRSLFEDAERREPVLASSENE